MSQFQMRLKNTLRLGILNPERIGNATTTPSICTVRLMPLIHYTGFCAVLASCNAVTAPSMVSQPDCGTIAEAVIEQAKRHDDTYFKRPVTIDTLTLLEERDAFLKCRGLATLTDGNVIPVHVMAKSYDGQWSYSMERGTDIK